VEWQRQARGEVTPGMPFFQRLGRYFSRPLRSFLRWLIRIGDLPEANAAGLATADREGKPSVRMVLVKDATDEGFVFYTNYESRKCSDLDDNPFAALVFHWTYPPRQVRVEGRVERLDHERNEAYWQTRPRGSQLGGLASKQSATLKERRQLEERFVRLRNRYRGKEIPCPSNWGGYRLVPERIEFWQGRTDRLHERVSYERNDEDGGWRPTLLQP
jgi:pyridoxamine 5'-phosphate oxidase